MIDRSNWGRGGGGGTTAGAVLLSHCAAALCLRPTVVSQLFFSSPELWYIGMLFPPALSCATQGTVQLCCQPGGACIPLITRLFLSFKLTLFFHCTNSFHPLVLSFTSTNPLALGNTGIHSEVLQRRLGIIERKKEISYANSHSINAFYV